MVNSDVEWATAPGAMHAPDAEAGRLERPRRPVGQEQREHGQDRQEQNKASASLHGTASLVVFRQPLAPVVTRDYKEGRL